MKKDISSHGICKTRDIIVAIYCYVKEKITKSFKVHMNNSSYFEISTPSFKRRSLTSTAPQRFRIK